MGFGGVGSMNIVMKNNRNLLNKKGRTKLKDIYGNNSSQGKTEYNLHKATPRQLNNLKLRLQEQRRKSNIKILLVFGLVFSSLIVILSTI